MFGNELLCGDHYLCRNLLYKPQVEKDSALASSITEDGLSLAVPLDLESGGGRQVARNKRGYEGIGWPIKNPVRQLKDGCDSSAIVGTHRDLF